MRAVYYEYLVLLQKSVYEELLRGERLGNRVVSSEGGGGGGGGGFKAVEWVNGLIRNDPGKWLTPPPARGTKKSVEWISPWRVTKGRWRWFGCGSQTRRRWCRRRGAGAG